MFWQDPVVSRPKLNTPMAFIHSYDFWNVSSKFTECSVQIVGTWEVVLQFKKILCLTMDKIYILIISLVDRKLIWLNLKLALKRIIYFWGLATWNLGGSALKFWKLFNLFWIRNKEKNVLKINYSRARKQGVVFCLFLINIFGFIFDKYHLRTPDGKKSHMDFCMVI